MHSFIDPGNLTTQAATDKYGPVTGLETTQFRPTSMFLLSSEARAFAVVNGQVIVQKQDNNLVNIVLRPTEVVHVGTTAVKYFIYRGIKKTGLLASDTALTAASDPNIVELAKRIWDDNVKQKAAAVGSGATVLDPVAADFGYDSGLGAGVLAGTVKLDAVFNGKHGVRTYIVEEGMWIGNFAESVSKKIGFEVILHDGDFNPTLDDVRAAEYKIVLPSATDNFDNRIRREDIRCFIDPAALYGHYYANPTLHVNKAVYSGATRTTVVMSDTDLYNNLIAKFSTKNRVYIDIRNEIGYSYNFYRNFVEQAPATDHDKQLRITERGSAKRAVEYQTNSWPFVYIEAVQSTGTKNEVDLELRTGDNGDPLLFMAEASLVMNTPPPAGFLAETFLLTSPGDKWTKSLKFEFPNLSALGSYASVANYIILHFFRQDDSSVNYSAGVLHTKGYTDNIFGPIDISSFADQDDPFKFVYMHDLKYVDGTLPNVTEPFGFVAERGVAYDSSRLICFARNLKTYRTTTKALPPGVSPTAAHFHLENSFFDLSSFKDVLMTADMLQVPKSGGGYEPVAAIMIEDHGGVSRWVENMLLLCITNTQLTTLKNATGFYKDSNNVHKHYRYVRPVQQGGTLTDRDGKAYFKYELYVHGLSSATNPADHQSSATGVIVYSRDGITFASKEFTTSGVELKLSHKRNYEEAIGAEVHFTAQSHAIIAVNTGSKTFTISGNITDQLTHHDTITVASSTGNNGTYTVTNAVFGSGNTVITVSQAIPSAVADGNVEYAAKTVEDYFIDKDQAGALAGAADEMRKLVKDFTTALQGIAADADSKSNLQTAIDNYAPKVLARGRALAQRNTFANPDDRILYWTRLRMLVVLQDHPHMLRSTGDARELVRRFEDHSRGFNSISFPGSGKKVLVSGYDPFFLKDIQGVEYPHKGNILQSNPSGAAALVLHGKTFNVSGVGDIHVQSVMFPVRYRDFEQDGGKGIVEQVFERYINPAHPNYVPVDTIITMSQGHVHRFDVDRFPCRNRKGEPDNEGKGKPKNPSFSFPSTPAGNEFYATTLPVANIVPATNPPTEKFPIYFNQTYIYNLVAGGTKKYEIDNIEGPTPIGNNPNGNDPTNLLPINQPAGAIRSVTGSGGNYLSNEIFYRVSLMRTAHAPSLKTGHLHVPMIQYGDPAAILRNYGKVVTRDFDPAITKELIQKIIDIISDLF